MNPPTAQPSFWKRPLFPSLHPVRFVRWLFGWRMIRRYLFCFACFATLIAIFYAEENWRGRHAWEACRRELTTQGMNLDWRSMWPPPLPDDRNFAQTPLLAPLFDFNPEPLKPGQNRWRDTNGYQRISNVGREFFDKPPAGQSQMEAWMLVLAPKPGSMSTTNSGKEKADTATEILLALQKYAPALDEIRAASHRPGSRFDIKYDSEVPAGILLPHLGIVKRFALMFEARALAELTVGQNDVAFADLQTILALADTMRTEPFVISLLVRISILQTCAHPVMVRGLSGHAWSDAQLQELEARLRNFALLPDMDRCLNSEAIYSAATFELLRRNPKLFVDEVGMFYQWKTPMTFLLRVIPKGWIYQEQITYLRAHGEQMLPIGELETGRVRPKLVAERMAALDKLSAGSDFSAFWQHKLIARALIVKVPAISYQKSALAQTALDQAFTACGLDRYRLANGHYPDTLASLTPQFASVIPNDVITGEPPKYHLTEGGNFILYSVGWNEKDDGGKIVLRKGNMRMDPAQGDWVWGVWGQMTE